MTNKIALTSSVIAVDLIPLLSHGAQGESDEALGRAQGIWWQAGTNIKLTLRCCCSQQKSLVVADFECMFRVKMHQKELTDFEKTKVKNVLFKTERKKSYSPSREDSTLDDWFWAHNLRFSGFWSFSPPSLISHTCLCVCWCSRKEMWIHEHELQSNQSSWVYKGPASLLVGSESFTAVLYLPELWWRPQGQWGGHGSPLQCSCLENPVGRGAWWATVHGVAKSRTLLSDWRTHTGSITELCMPQAESSRRHSELSLDTPWPSYAQLMAIL